MKILGLYEHETLSLLRRVRAPFSVLASRNHHFNLLKVSAFTNGVTFSSDVTVLADWLLSESELEVLRIAAQSRAIVVDCSNPDLLGDELYREQLSIASLVTVPNDWMRSAIRALNPNTWVIQSCVDFEHFALANQIKMDPRRPLCLGCLGPFDWYLVSDAILTLLDRHPRLTVIADLKTYETLPKHQRILGLAPTVHNLAEIIRNIHIGIMPIDGERGYDDIWRYEYGILCRPTISLSSSKKETWVERIEAYLASRKLRVERGQEAYEAANLRRSTKIADKYLSLYRKRLPHLLFS